MRGNMIKYRPSPIYGGIAQLGERLNGIQEVRGSIPLISTKKKRASKRMSFSFCFGVWDRPADRGRGKGKAPTCNFFGFAHAKCRLFKAARKMLHGFRRRRISAYLHQKKRASKRMSFSFCFGVWDRTADKGRGKGKAPTCNFFGFAHDNRHCRSTKVFLYAFYADGVDKRVVGGSDFCGVFVQRVIGGAFIGIYNLVVTVPLVVAVQLE